MKILFATFNNNDILTNRCIRSIIEYNVQFDIDILVVNMSNETKENFTLEHYDSVIIDNMLYDNILKTNHFHRNATHSIGIQYVLDTYIKPYDFVFFIHNDAYYKSRNDLIQSLNFMSKDNFLVSGKIMPCTYDYSFYEKTHFHEKEHALGVFSPPKIESLLFSINVKKFLKDFNHIKYYDEKYCDNIFDKHNDLFFLHYSSGSYLYLQLFANKKMNMINNVNTNKYLIHSKSL